MGKKKQLPLPKLDIERFTVRKNPQPRSVDRVKIKKFEILHHPFDLKFKGRINRWLDQFDSGRLQGVTGNIETKNKLSAILDDSCLEVVELYFYPGGERRKWLNQKDILKKTKIGNKKKLRELLVACLLKVWESCKK